MKKGTFEYIIRESGTNDNAEDVAMQYLIDFLCDKYCSAYDIQTAFGRRVQDKVEDLLPLYDKLELLDNIVCDVKDLIKLKLLQYMELHQQYKIEDNRFEAIYKAEQEKNHFDQKQFERDFPELYRKYRHPTVKTKATVCFNEK